MKIDDFSVTADEQGYPFWVRLYMPGGSAVLSWEQAIVYGEAIRMAGEQARIRQEVVDRKMGRA